MNLVVLSILTRRKHRQVHISRHAACCTQGFRVKSVRCTLIELIRLSRIDTIDLQLALREMMLVPTIINCRVVASTDGRYGQ